LLFLFTDDQGCARKSTNIEATAIVLTVALAGTAEYLQRAPVSATPTIAHRTSTVPHAQRLAQTDPNSGTANGTQIQQSELEEEQAEQQQNPPPPPPPPPGR
jgi:hypothetical protein